MKRLRVRGGKQKGGVTNHPGLPFGVNLGIYLLNATSHRILGDEDRAASMHAASHYPTNAPYLNLSTDLKGLPCVSSLLEKTFLFHI